MNRPAPTDADRVSGRAGTACLPGARIASAAWRVAGFTILAVCLGSGSTADRAPSTAEEYRLKAAFLFHFAQLVDWPSGALGADTNPVTLCTLGIEAFDELDAVVVGKLIGTRPLRVLHLKPAQDIRGCHLLFVGSGERTRVPLLLAGLKRAAILTVGETDGFVRQGGIIGFCLEDKKVRFDINLDASQRAGLKISSRLMLLAKSVTGDADSR